MKKFPMLIFLLISCYGHAQTITSKDFKLYLDDIASTDTVVRLTKHDLLEAKKITANFSWLTIKSLTIYTGNDMPILSSCKGNTICDEAKKIWERILPGTFVIIQVEGYNKKGQKIDWVGMHILVTE